MLKIDQARRIAIRATGLGEARPASRITARHLRKVVGQVGVVQIDSVNAVARAHDLLFFSRLGPFDRRLLHELTYDKRELYEGWLHVASLIPTDWWPMLDFRRRETSFHLELGAREKKVVEEVLARIRDEGAIGVSDTGHLGPKGQSWWGWSLGKIVLERLFATGHVGVTTRRGAFERVYDLTERVMPASVLTAPAVPEHEARRRLLLEAARAHGIGTLKDLGDYHRQKVTQTKPVLRELVAEGALLEHAVEGWTEPAYSLPDVSVPRTGCPDGRLVSPFDPLVWYRQRNERLFDFRYAIEIYTPEPKRVYGYYVLPFLQGDQIVARVDVRSDRKAGVLRVPGAFSEDGVKVDVAGLAAELRLLGQWQGCDEIEVGEKGDLAVALARSVA